MPLPINIIIMPLTIAFRNLYPHLTDEELTEAERNIDRYLQLVLQIFERLELENGPDKPF